MQTRAFVATLALCGAAVSIPVLAGPEAGHPNIIAAREDAQHAIEKMHAAQVANEYDLGGHAAKAEKLLAQADQALYKQKQAGRGSPSRNSPVIFPGYRHGFSQFGFRAPEASVTHRSPGKSRKSSTGTV